MRIRAAREKEEEEEKRKEKSGKSNRIDIAGYPWLLPVTTGIHRLTSMDIR